MQYRQEREGEGEIQGEGEGERKLEKGREICTFEFTAEMERWHERREASSSVK